MFNLIVGFTKGVADASRMLEFTDEDVRLYVAPGGRVAASRLLHLPTLVMPETGDSDLPQVARIGRLTHVKLTGNQFRYDFTTLHEVPSEYVEANANPLGIDDFEFVRTHWAVKDADLYAVLDEHLAGASQPVSTDGDVADMLTRLSEGEADTFLTTVGASPTPSGWSTRSLAARRLQVKALLEGLSPLQQESLSGALQEEFAERVESRPSTDSALQDPSSPRKAHPAAPAPTGKESDHSQSTVDPTGPIFVVHGHDHSTLHLAVRILERSTDREVIVLHEQANSGRTVLEKFEHHATSAAFAVVLLTADDEGAQIGSTSHRKRARQNVIFELGFFFGQLGRERVVVLVDQGVEQPSDISGLVYIALDAAGAWKIALGRELEAASIPVDYRRMP